jgi:hypothetical protein
MHGETVKFNWIPVTTACVGVEIWTLDYTNTTQECYKLMLSEVQLMAFLKGFLQQQLNYSKLKKKSYNKKSHCLPLAGNSK